MKILNLKAGKLMPNSIDICDKQPCWYAHIETATNRKDYKWKVGCKQEGGNKEISFKLSKAGNVKDDKFWEYATSIEFATKLIELFKKGGEQSVKSWVKSGCQ